MKATFTGFALLGAALFCAPAALEAQAPVMLVCHDGTTQPGSSRVACGDHGGMDWNATKSWSEMRAGHFMASDTVVCTDGQAQAAAPKACGAHGGVDSVSTIAALHRRARADRYAHHGRANRSADSTGQGTSGYRAMERVDSASPGMNTPDSAGNRLEGTDSTGMSIPPADSAAARNGGGQPARADSAR